MRRGASYRRRNSGGRLLLLTIFSWALTALVILALINEISIFRNQSDDQPPALQYVEQVFPTLSRGLSPEGRTGVNTAALNTDVLIDSEKLYTGLLHNAFPGIRVLGEQMIESEENLELGEWEGESQEVLDSQTNLPVNKPSTVRLDMTKPVVLIYHTHATESYQPVSAGNFHSVEEAGTVREVGEVLTQALQAKGIQVIHDKTLHDSPSYSESYTRSLETMTKLLAQYPSAKIIIDLHRDAASYNGNKSKTLVIDGKTAADFSLVIGTKNANASQLTVFAEYINHTANQLYPDFGGKIITKPYKFNEYLSDYYLLLEIGNNENTIEQAKVTGTYFADVLELAIKEIQ